MAAASADFGGSVAGVFFFNLLVGTGVNALPALLSTAGVWLALGFLVVVAATAFVSATWMVETQSLANALLQDSGVVESPAANNDPITEHKSRKESSLGGEHNRVDDNDPFAITTKVEMGRMADELLPRWQRTLTYVILCLYLLGDLTIYASFVAKSVAQFADDVGAGHASILRSFPFWLLVFATSVGPFCYFNFSKTKLLQWVMFVVRQSALWTMIVLAFVSCVSPALSFGPEGAESARHEPVDYGKVRVSALPAVFGGAVYSFMTHHSIPSMVTPCRIRNGTRRQLLKLMGGVYLLVLAVYVCLFMSTYLAFGERMPKHEGDYDPITLAFSTKTKSLSWLGNALVLFPVLSLCSSYPLIAITLRSNVEQLFRTVSKSGLASAQGAGLQNGWSAGRSEKERDKVVALEQPLLGTSAARERREVCAVARKNLQHLLLSTFVAGAPIVIALVLHWLHVDVGAIVSYIGGYTGSLVMFILPARLVHAARRRAHEQLPELMQRQDLASSGRMHKSPFQQTWQTYAVGTWGLVVLLLITVNKVEEAL